MFTRPLTKTLTRGLTRPLYGFGGDSIMDTALLFGRDFKIAFDSRTANNSTISPNSGIAVAVTPTPLWADRTVNHIENQGVIGNTLPYLNGRAFFDPFANYGIGGDDSNDFEARIAAFYNNPAHYALLLGWVNDVGVLTPAQTITNIEQMIATLRATSEIHPYGHRIVIEDGMPDASLTGGDLTDYYEVVDYIRSINEPEVFIASTMNAVSTAADSNVWKTDYAYDDKHQAPKGAFAAAYEAVVPVVRQLIPPRTDLILNSEGATGILNTNPSMSGTGGTVTSSFTGSLADNWTTLKGATYAGSTVLLTLSKEVIDGRTYQKIDLSGIPIADNEDYYIYTTLDVSGLDVGDLLRAAGRVRFSGLTNMVGVTLQTYNENSTTRMSALDGYNKDRLSTASALEEQIQITPLHPKKTGATNYRVLLHIEAGAALAPVGGTIYLGDVTAKEYAVAPEMVVAPAITGTAQVGQTLTASTGTWQGTQSITYAYQWKANGVAIGGATSSTYALTSSELGDTITCTVTATNSAGSTIRTTAATAAVTLQYVTAVKRYSVTIPALTASATVTVDAMDSRSLIFATFRGTATSTGANATNARIIRTNDTTITLQRQSAASSPTVTAEIEIWYATDQLVESVEYGVVAFTAANTATATITSVDTSRTSVVWLGSDSNSATQSAGRQNSDVVLTNSTTVTGNTTNTPTGSTAFMAIQWAAGAVSSVQNIALTSTSASATETSTITSVDVNRSLVFFGGQSGGLAGVADLCYTSQLTAATTVTHTRVGTAVTSRRISRSVVQFVAGVFAANVQRGTIDLTGVTSNTATITDVGITKGFSLFNGWRSASTGAQPTTTWATETLTNGTTVTGAANATGNTTVIAYAAGQLT